MKEITIDDQINILKGLRENIVQEDANGIRIVSELYIMHLDKAIHTLEIVRLTGVPQIMHCKEMFEFISSMVGSGWLNKKSEGWHAAANELWDKIVFKPRLPGEPFEKNV